MTQDHKDHKANLTKLIALAHRPDYRELLFIELVEMMDKLKEKEK